MPDEKPVRPPQNTYNDALAAAWNKLEGKAPAAAASCARLEYDPIKQVIVLPFLADIYKVDLHARKVLFENEHQVYPFLSVLLLHYLIGANGLQPAGEWISFREFEGGDVYFGSFTNRTLIPLKNTFGENPELLAKAAAPLGAEPLGLGDVGLRIPVFPKLPLAVLLWKGDAEFPPDVNVLFDKTANRILRTEDLAICGALTMSRLRKNAERLIQQK